jgi:uncharacterized membrane protein (DUF106 family)
MERSELEVVKEEIVEVKAELTEAKRVRDREMVLALNNRLTELQKKENLLLAQASAGMSRLTVSLLFLILFCVLYFIPMILPMID